MVRPDSGDPATVVVKVLEILGKFIHNLILNVCAKVIIIIIGMETSFHSTCV